MPADHAWTEVEPPEGEHRWTWSPQGLRDLARVRREFRARITDPGAGSGMPDLDDDRVEQCVLALEELMSNGLRHGRAPVEVDVSAAAEGLLIQVHDRDPRNPPRPTSTRDPGLGGMGLGMVAHVSVACGWTPRGDRKTVWALMPTTAVA